MRIHQTLNPDGVVAVDVIDAAGVRKGAWHGFEIDLKGAVARGVVIVLDTKKVAGWDEIDVVEFADELADE